MEETQMTDIQQMQEQAERAWDQGHSAQASTHLEQALALVEAREGPAHPVCAELLTRLGEVAQTQGEHAQAEGFYRRALTLCEQVYGPEHAATIGRLGDLAGILDEQGEATQAELLYQRALLAAQRVLGAEHLDTALATAKLARFYRATGHYTQAEPLFARALALYEQHAPQDTGNHAICLTNAAVLSLDTQGPAQAEWRLRQALRLRTSQVGPAHPLVAGPLAHLARALRMQGEPLLADLLLARALALREAALGREHADTVALRELRASWQAASSEPQAQEGADA